MTLFLITMKTIDDLIADCLKTVDEIYPWDLEKAMETKDFSEVDRLKSAYQQAGLEVRISKTGVSLIPSAGFDIAQLENLV